MGQVFIGSERASLKNQKREIGQLFLTLIEQPLLKIERLVCACVCTLVSSTHGHTPQLELFPFLSDLLLVNITMVMKMRDLISISSGHWTTENTCSGFKGRNWGQN